MPAVQPLSFDLDCDDAEPHFEWDVPIIVEEWRLRLRHDDPDTRAL